MDSRDLSGSPLKKRRIDHSPSSSSFDLVSFCRQFFELLPIEIRSAAASQFQIPSFCCLETASDVPPPGHPWTRSILKVLDEDTIERCRTPEFCGFLVNMLNSSTSSAHQTGSEESTERVISAPESRDPFVQFEAGQSSSESSRTDRDADLGKWREELEISLKALLKQGLMSQDLAEGGGERDSIEALPFPKVVSALVAIVTSNQPRRTIVKLLPGEISAPVNTRIPTHVTSIGLNQMGLPFEVFRLILSYLRRTRVLLNTVGLVSREWHNAVLFSWESVVIFPATLRRIPQEVLSSVRQIACRIPYDLSVRNGKVFSKSDYCYLLDSIHPQFIQSLDLSDVAYERMSSNSYLFDVLLARLPSADVQARKGLTFPNCDFLSLPRYDFIREEGGSGGLEVKLAMALFNKFYREEFRNLLTKMFPRLVQIENVVGWFAPLLKDCECLREGHFLFHDDGGVYANYLAERIRRLPQPGFSTNLVYLHCEIFLRARSRKSEIPFAENLSHLKQFDVTLSCIEDDGQDSYRDFCYDLAMPSPILSVLRLNLSCHSPVTIKLPDDPQLQELRITLTKFDPNETFEPKTKPRKQRKRSQRHRWRKQLCGPSVANQFHLLHRDDAKFALRLISEDGQSLESFSADYLVHLWTSLFKNWDDRCCLPSRFSVSVVYVTEGVEDDIVRFVWERIDTVFQGRVLVRISSRNQSLELGLVLECYEGCSLYFGVQDATSFEVLCDDDVVLQAGQAVQKPLKEWENED